jgi:hypothetical protein
MIILQHRKQAHLKLLILVLKFLNFLCISQMPNIIKIFLTFWYISTKKSVERHVYVHIDRQIHTYTSTHSIYIYIWSKESFWSKLIYLNFHRHIESMPIEYGSWYVPKKWVGFLEVQPIENHKYVITIVKTCIVVNFFTREWKKDICMRMLKRTKIA